MSLPKNISALLDRDRGPILRVDSALKAGFRGGRAWHSTAELHPDLFEDRAALPSNQYCGSGWSRNKALSREKAVTEAVERWAYYTYQRRPPAEAGLDIEASCNGFAAMPASAGRAAAFRNAYCEALERWTLNRAWQFGDIFLERLAPAAEVRRLVAGAANHAFFGGVLEPAAPRGGLPRRLHFRLCLLKTRAGGAVAGSACGAAAGAAFSRAAEEARTHLRDFYSLYREAAGERRHRPGRRLFHFGSLRDGFSIVMDTLKTAPRAVPRRAPGILFSKTLPGPWEPVFRVHRVLLDSSGASR